MNNITEKFGTILSIPNARGLVFNRSINARGHILTSDAMLNELKEKKKRNEKKKKIRKNASKSEKLKNNKKKRRRKRRWKKSKSAWKQRHKKMKEERNSKKKTNEIMFSVIFVENGEHYHLH